MLLLALDPPLRDRPDGAVRVELLPAGADGLAGARGRQDGELERPGGDALLSP